MDPGTTTVTIYGQQYTVRSEGDPEQVRRVAEFVDDRMREVARASNQVSSVRVAILAALNIADELFRERDNGSVELTVIEERAQALATQLEQSMVGFDPEPGDDNGAQPASEHTAGDDRARADAQERPHQD